jgi:2-amino-4-hydroxy-6-hydroxymethyldihydropteridine diphosphokinase
MSAEEVFIAIGSNIGDSETIVEEAFAQLGKIKDSKLTGKSSLYRTEPVSDIPQDDYINAAAKLDTDLEPMALLLELQAIEHAYYRQRDPEQRWAPRTLDLDIILFGDRVIADSHLTVPHCEFANRMFVLRPLLEIAGERFIPGFGSLQYLIDHAPEIRMTKLDHPDQRA